MELSNAGTLTPREVELLARLVERICHKQGIERTSLAGELVAVQVLQLFELNRDLDEDALMVKISRHA